MILPRGVKNMMFALVWMQWSQFWYFEIIWIVKLCKEVKRSHVFRPLIYDIDFSCWQLHNLKIDSVQEIYPGVVVGRARRQRSLHLCWLLRTDCLEFHPEFHLGSSDIAKAWRTYYAGRVDIEGWNQLSYTVTKNFHYHSYANWKST